MSCRQRTRILVLTGTACLLGVLWASAPVFGGMAELGRKKRIETGSLPESGTDLAAQDGLVTVQVGSQPYTCNTATTPACATVNGTLTAIADAINSEMPQKFKAAVGICNNLGDPTNGTLCVLSDVEDPCVVAAGSCNPDPTNDKIKVLRKNGTEVDQFGMVNTDSGFGLVEAEHSGGTLFLLGVCEPPSGEDVMANPGTVQIAINNVPLAAIDTSMYVGDPDGLNDAVATLVGGEVKGTGECGVDRLDPTRLRITVPGNVQMLAWEDTDTQIVTIGVRNSVGAQEEIIIPTLSEWAALLFATLLGLMALWILRRRTGGTVA